VVFERLFGTDDLNVPADVRARRMAERKSILDLVGDDTRRLENNLGRADRHKIDEYLFAVRDLETRIEASEKEHREYAGMIDKPAGVPVLFKDYLALMFDLQILALQGDLTRVVSLMYGREASLRTYAEIGIPEPHHPLTHHQGNKEWIEKFTRINVYHTENYVTFLTKLKATQDGDGTLFDHAAMLYGSGLSEPNSHSKINLPTVVTGKANGRFKGGRRIVYPKGTPMANLFMNLLDFMDVHPESIGDSTGKLDYLSDLS
jgi:hypothetical protein